MNNWIAKLSEIAEKERRLIIGLMSGTSLDGLDIALCKISGSGLNTKAQVLAFETISYSDEFKNQIKKIAFLKIVDLELLCSLNKKIGEMHGEMVNSFLKSRNINPENIDLIASHGQTIYHSPANSRESDGFGNSTLQIGDADQISVKTNIVTVSDFRQKNIAQGLEGAPLAIYGDYLLFNHPTENRILLNIGGISNFTYLPAGGKFNTILSTDVGPGNKIMDQFINKIDPQLFYDKNGEMAALGKTNEEFLAALLNHSFFELSFPKSTGPELFNLDYLYSAISKCKSDPISNQDILATLNLFTAKSIEIAIRKTTANLKDTVIYISGGGNHNFLLTSNLKNLLHDCSFKNLSDLGINPDAKEALLFAILANETVAGDYKDLNNETLSMGKISLPF
ncbi:anhydro-N-acetylmuramic acid kinase [Pedobacter psychrophilus]|uniref:Anhydro-N-acetylmuramic acid kinase n=1 Tax=Pedobacter psychrophilus TaxID=1826909 RepID=A0A179DF11_9SPHI|nr:anhydro-N-acetylmuramic acid kinase [Pedobacter psychrophilus]OAQ39063.1 anhydro-N-acetylmuramic acid kinase [Pedobacter psychrophilus]